MIIIIQGPQGSLNCVDCDDWLSEDETAEAHVRNHHWDGNDDEEFNVVHYQDI